MQTNTASKSRSKKAAVAAENVSMLAAPDMTGDLQIAALLEVLGNPGGSGNTDLVAMVNELPAIEPAGHVEIIESAGVETLNLGSDDLIEIVETAIEILPALTDDEHADVLEAVSASITVSESYAAVPGDTAAPIEGASVEELKAASEEVGSGTVDPIIARAPRAPRVHYQNKTDRIVARLGDKLGDYLVLEINDADLQDGALKAKQDETLAVIDAMSVKVKNRASLLMDWLSGKSVKPNEILRRALTVLAADGNITTGDKGNLHLNLISKPL